MATPASRQLLQQALQQAQQLHLSASRDSLQLKIASLAGNVAQGELINLMKMLTDGMEKWAEVRQLSGILPYAKIQWDDQSYNLVTEFLANEAAALSLRDWINAALPNARHPVPYTLDGTDSDLFFTPSDLADFRTAADALLATYS